jgi:mevalonate kinase
LKDDLQFDNRKDVHITLLRDTHAALRIMLFKYKVSMREVFEEMAMRIVNEDPDMLQILDEIYENKKQKKIKKLSESDAKSLYEVIQGSSPFSD